MNLLPEPDLTIEVSPADVARWIHLPADERPLLVDCREDDEVGICRIDGSEWIPMAKIPASVERIAAGARNGVVVYCHHGMRSLRSAEFLRSYGLDHTFSMNGGIDRWSAEVDGKVPRY